MIRLLWAHEHILRRLANEYPGYALFARTLSDINMSEAVVLSHFRALAKIEFVKRTVVFDEDTGRPCGSGYAATNRGRKHLLRLDEERGMTP